MTYKISWRVANFNSSAFFLTEHGKKKKNTFVPMEKLIINIVAAFKCLKLNSYFKLVTVSYNDRRQTVEKW